MVMYGYVRVSTINQCEDRQLVSMAELNIPPERIFVDKVSGKDFNRPMYQALTDRLQSGDLLYIKSIDRLGRNYEDILNQWRILTKERGVDIAIIDMPILDTRNGKDLIGTFLADVVLALLSYVSEQERTMIKQRQAEGIAAARAQGKHLGRPAKNPPAGFAKLVKRFERKETPLKKILDECGGVCPATFYRWLAEYRANERKKG